MERGLFNRTERLVGKEVMHTIKNKRVIILALVEWVVGVPSVWCAQESVISPLSIPTVCV